MDVRRLDGGSGTTPGDSLSSLRPVHQGDAVGMNSRMDLALTLLGVMIIIVILVVSGR